MREMRSPIVQDHFANEERQTAAGRNQREAQETRRQTRPQGTLPEAAPYRMIPVNEALLARSNSYGAPDFVRRGSYIDLSFRCVDCGTEEIWIGTQQKWWYEVAKGFVYSSAICCRSCRRRERERRDEARRFILRA